MSNLKIFILFGGLLVAQGALSAEKALPPDEKCVKSLEGLAKTISSGLNSYVFNPVKTPNIKIAVKKPDQVESETSESRLKVTVGDDVFDFIIKDLTECRIDKLTVTKSYDN